MTTLQNISSVDDFAFPYNYKFPGQASDEAILYVTREHKSLLYARQISVLIVSLLIITLGFGLSGLLRTYIDQSLQAGLQLTVLAIGIGTLLIGWWWHSSMWKKSMAFVTNKRLKKIIYTTPFNKHTLSLPLEMIVDTGSYSKGFLQAVLGLGTFTARSSASSSGLATDDGERINKKYFYIENVAKVEDLQHYITKLLSSFRKNSDGLLKYRPFLPNLKGEDRKDFMKQFPEYWS